MGSKYIVGGYPHLICKYSYPAVNPITFTKVENSIGDVKFTITEGSSCPVSFNYNTQESFNAAKLETGTPIVTWPEVTHPTGGCLPPRYNVTYYFYFSVPRLLRMGFITKALLLCKTLMFWYTGHIQANNLSVFRMIIP